MYGSTACTSSQVSQTTTTAAGDESASAGGGAGSGILWGVMGAIGGRVARVALAGAFVLVRHHMPFKAKSRCMAPKARPTQSLCMEEKSNCESPKMCARRPRFRGSWLPSGFSSVSLSDSQLARSTLATQARR